MSFLSLNPFYPLLSLFLPLSLFFFDLPFLPPLPSFCAHLTANHWGIFPEAGFQDIREYRYYKQATRGLDFEGMIQDLKVQCRLCVCGVEQWCESYPAVYISIKVHWCD